MHLAFHVSLLKDWKIASLHEDHLVTTDDTSEVEELVVLCPLHVRCSSEFSASHSYARTLSDSETQPTNEWFTITDRSKGTVQDAPMVYIYNQM